MKKIIGLLILVSVTCDTPVSLKAQSSTGTVLEYRFPKLTSVPPFYSGQPLDVALGYYWFDIAMSTHKRYSIDSFFWGMQYGDTAKYIADAIYRITDDNPISFHLWQAGRGVSPDPYRPKADPSHAKITFANHYAVICNDTGRSGFLLTSDIIAHVKVIDTVSMLDSTALLAKHLVRVTTQIMDGIKGKYVPNCVYDTSYSVKGGYPKPAYFNNTTNAHRADSGSCLQFFYSYDWDLMPFSDEGIMAPMKDSTGTWIRPNIEYIVFLGIQSTKTDSANHYFTIKPLWGVFGNSGAMYPIFGGIVYDPNDDFGIGANMGLTVSQWKTRLRARIDNIVNP